MIAVRRTILRLGGRGSQRAGAAGVVVVVIMVIVVIVSGGRSSGGRSGSSSSAGSGTLAMPVITVGSAVLRLSRGGSERAGASSVVIAIVIVGSRGGSRGRGFGLDLSRGARALAVPYWGLDTNLRRRKGETKSDRCAARTHRTQSAKGPAPGRGQREASPGGQQRKRWSSCWKVEW